MRILITQLLNPTQQGDIYDSIIPDTKFMMVYDDDYNLYVKSDWKNELFQMDDISDLQNGYFNDYSEKSGYSEKYIKGMVTSLIEEDEDGMYDIIEENGGKIEFIYPEDGLNHLTDIELKSYGEDFLGLLLYEFHLSLDISDGKITQEGKEIGIVDIVNQADEFNERSLIYLI